MWDSPQNTRVDWLVHDGFRLASVGHDVGGRHYAQRVRGAFLLQLFQFQDSALPQGPRGMSSTYQLGGDPRDVAALETRTVELDPGRLTGSITARDR